MPIINGKHMPYTKENIAMAKKMSEMKKKKMPMSMAKKSKQS